MLCWDTTQIKEKKLKTFSNIIPKNSKDQNSNIVQNP